MEGEYISYHTSENSEELLRIYPTKLRRVHALQMPDENNNKIVLAYNHSVAIVRLTPCGCDLKAGAIAILLRPHHITHIKIMPVNKIIKSRVTMANTDWHEKIIHCFFPNLQVENIHLNKNIYPTLDINELMITEETSELEQEES